MSLLKFTWDEGEDSFLACPPQLTLAIGQREVAVPYRWGRVRLCKRYGVICTATPRHPGRPIMSHARAGRCATGVHRCFMRPGVSTPAVRDATARRVALARGRVASFSSGASAAADDQDPPCRLKSGRLRHRRAPPHWKLPPRGCCEEAVWSRPPRGRPRAVGTHGRAVRKLLGASRYSSRPTLQRVEPRGPSSGHALCTKTQPFRRPFRHSNWLPGRSRCPGGMPSLPGVSATHLATRNGRGVIGPHGKKTLP